MSLLEDYLGIEIATVPDFVIAFLIILLGIGISQLIHYIIQNKLKKMAQTTKTTIDDSILEILEKPLQFAIVLSALYFGLMAIEQLVPYRATFADSLFVVFAFLFTYVIEQFVSRLIPQWLHITNRKYQKSTTILVRIIKAALYIIASLIVLDHFHIEITPLIAALGIGGLAVGLALNDSLSNFFAGLYIVSASPIQVGDYVELPLEKISGYVEDIGWRATKLRTITNTTLIIPNAKLSQSILVNTYLPNREVDIPIEFTIPATSDLEKIETISVEVGEKIQNNVAGAVKNFKPFVRYTASNPDTITFTITLSVEEYTARFLLTHEYIKEFKKRLDQEGVKRIKNKTRKRGTDD